MRSFSHISGQHRALVHTFLARFFENEITSGTDDLTRSLFGLMAFLVVPGILMPLTMSSSYAAVARAHGVEALQRLSRGDKVLYLGISMIASAGLAALTWNSLAIDRRDGEILGALPVPSSTIVLSKMAALTAYIVLVTSAMHAAAAVLFGMVLAANNSLLFMLRAVFAHFLASCSMSLFVFFAAVAVQAVLLAAVGPRMFARLSSALHVALIISTVVALLALPALSSSIADTVRETGAHSHPWVLSTPPAWFLGLYEWILGMDNPLLRQLAQRAVLLLGGVVMITFTAYPFACRRLMSAAIEGTAQARGTARRRQVAHALALVVGRDADLRAISQFFLASLGRVDRLRLVVTVGVGVAVAWGVPGWLSLRSGLPRAPTMSLLSLSYAAMMFVLVALRVAAAIPSDVKAGWIFQISPLDRRHVRVAVERTLVALGVLLPVFILAPAYWWLWGTQVAAIHALVSAAAGILLTECLLWGDDVVPCSRRWKPQGITLGRWWAVYVMIFILFTGPIPAIELLLLVRPEAVAVFLAGVLMVTVLVRHMSLQQPSTPDEEPTDVVVQTVLGLD